MLLHASRSRHVIAALVLATISSRSAAFSPAAAASTINSAPNKPHIAASPFPSLRGTASARRGTVALSAASLEAAAGPPTGIPINAAIINLAKNIVGSGVLALSAGVAAFSGSPLALLPSIALLLLTGGISAYTFSTIARVGAASGANTYRDTWAKVFGEKLAFLPDITVVFMTACAGLSYSIIIGDMFSGVAKLAGATGALASSNTWILALSAFVLLPLALLRDLSALAIGSVIGTAGTCYTALFVFLRLLDGSYSPGGKFFEAIAASSQPLFAAPSAARPLLNSGAFVLLSMLASAYLAHYNAPKFYDELQAPKDGSSKLKSFNLVCLGAFGAAAVLMGSIMCGGFLTFGSNAQGLILNNYATSDPLAFIARLGIGMSIIFSYPLNFVGLRGGVRARPCPHRPHEPHGPHGPHDPHRPHDSHLRPDPHLRLASPSPPPRLPLASPSPRQSAFHPLPKRPHDRTHPPPAIAISTSYLSRSCRCSACSAHQARRRQRTSASPSSSSA